MKKSTLVLTAILASLLSSCEKEIQFNGEQSKDLLVINSLVVADNTITAKVSHSIFFLNDNNNQNTYVLDVNMELFVNDVSQGNMTYQGNDQKNATYTTPYVARRGDRITIKATHNLYDAVVASTYVPDATVINDVSVSYKKGSYGNNMAHFFINFNDNGATTDYYDVKILAFTWDDSSPTPHRSYFSAHNKVFSNDIVFGNTSTTNFWGETSQKGVSVFDDYLFNGKQYTLDVFTYHYDYYNYDSIEVRINTISRDYYLFRKSFDAYREGDFFGEIFGEPVQVYTNVEGGIGLVAGITENSFRLKMPTP